jgi:hypothetical protein
MMKRLKVTKKIWDVAVKEYQRAASMFTIVDRYIGVMADKDDADLETEEGLGLARTYWFVKDAFEAAEKRLHELREAWRLDYYCRRRKSPAPPFPDFKVRYSKKFPLKEFSVLEQAQRELYSPCFRRVNTKGVFVQ